MKYTIIEEWRGGRRLPEVQSRERARLYVTTKMFPNEKELKLHIAKAVDVSELDIKIVFQDTKKSLAKVYAKGYNYQYYCLRIEKDLLLFYNLGLNSLIFRERRF